MSDSFPSLGGLLFARPSTPLALPLIIYLPFMFAYVVTGVNMWEIASIQTLLVGHVALAMIMLLAQRLALSSRHPSQERIQRYTNALFAYLNDYGRLVFVGSFVADLLPQSIIRTMLDAYVKSFGYVLPLGYAVTSIFLAKVKVDLPLIPFLDGENILFPVVDVLVGPCRRWLFGPDAADYGTSAPKRESSLPEGSKGASRCKVLDEGPHFNRTARGCLL